MSNATRRSPTQRTEQNETDRRKFISPHRVNPLIAVCEDTQKKFRSIWNKDVQVRNGVFNTRHYAWTYPCRNESCKLAPKNNTVIEFFNKDTIDCSHELQNRGFKVAAMNMANPDTPTNWEGGARAQEECLMYRSTYALSLDYEYKVNKNRRWSYPLKEVGGVYSPDNLVFKDSNFDILPKEKMFYMDFVAIAGLQCPDTKKKRLIHEYDIETTKEKMRAFFRICHMNGVNCPVAGALGCGVFGNPPEHISLLWREVINEPEFRNMFCVIAFAILDGKTTNNFGIFQSRIKFDDEVDSDDSVDDEPDWNDIDSFENIIPHEYFEWEHHNLHFSSESDGNMTPPLPPAPSTTPSTSPPTATAQFQFDPNSSMTFTTVPPFPFNSLRNE